MSNTLVNVLILCQLGNFNILALIFELSEALIFPNTQLAEPDGLLAIGGDLSTDRLLLAYQLGIFPWFNEGEEILWYSPDPRFVLFPDELHISHSMKKLWNRQEWTVTENKAFTDVMNACASIKRPNQSGGTWIGEQMIRSYTQLHSLGFAKSIEVWDAEHALIGGLYGVVLNNCFFGESMFSRVNNTSKYALIHLCKRHNYRIIDCQIYSQHLAKLGAKHIALDDFQKLIQDA